ncbi:MAG TPA: DUF4224 domain-containing protein [Anaerolineaceae bacterium]|nr:DUF4224 domain-containing protein [Anaerolineaceae bacterium]
MFLTPDEIVALTGRKLKGAQIAQLRTMGIPFYVNAVGRPVVVRAVLETKQQEQPKPRWQPKVLQGIS